MDSEPLNSTNAIWDDGEWISWDEIDRYLVESGQIETGDDYDSYEDSPERSTQDKLDELEVLVHEAQQLVRRGLREQIDFGEMGELYAEIRYNLKRHRKCAEGSDGRIGNDFIEVKTITPWKGKARVKVRRQGHFNQLVIVKVTEHFMFEARKIRRAMLPKGKGGKMASISWNSLPEMNAKTDRDGT